MPDFLTKPLLLSVALLMLALPLAAKARTPKAATAPYRPELGQTSPTLDVYSFKGAKNAPVVVYVHGGGWQTGDKAHVLAKPGHFAQGGYVFVSLNYRLVPDVTVETQLEDIDAALGWVTAHIGEYGGDPANIVLLGHSAGAHLVTMTGVAPLEQAAGLIESGALRGVISNDTRAYDIPRIATIAGGRLAGAYVAPFGQNPGRWKRLSPLTYITGPKPPFLVLYSGAGNGRNRREISENFASRLRAAGGMAETFDGGAYSHSQMNKGIGTIPDLTAAIDRFLARVTQ